MMNGSATETVTNEAAKTSLETSLEKLPETLKETLQVTLEMKVPEPKSPEPPPHAHASQEIPSNIYKPKDPFMATIKAIHKLTGENSPNDVRHVVFDLQGSDLWYLDGQSLGVLPPGVDVAGKPEKLRLYSIASPTRGDDGTGTTATLCVKRLLYTNEQGVEVKGVCSNYICDLKVGDKVQVTGPVGKAFLLPAQADANLIMIATGTGIAPFRAFLSTRYNARKHEQGQAHLFFGVQYGDDYLYKDELETYQAENVTCKVHVAISREQKTASGQKMYVQHRIAEHAAEVLALLEKPNTYLYMCGLKGMESGILEVMQAECEAKGKDWNALFARLQQEKRWHIEVY
jgi:ferredoxin--NADP+ reductase